MNKYGIPVVVAMAVIAGGAVYATKKHQDNVAMSNSNGWSAAQNEAMMKESTPNTAMIKERESMAMMKDGGAAAVVFTTQTDAQNLITEHGKDVVYFFAASWCPDCQAIKKHLQNSADLSKLGKNTVIEEVDYDHSKELKTKYSITHQTAFVRIDASGNATKQAILSNFDDVLTF